MLDLYFKKPIFWDYFLCMIFCATSIYLVKKNIIILPSKEETISITSDITNISLTLAGFILTILTVLITFKSSSKQEKIDIENDETVFNLFFASGYYFVTVKHIKNCLNSLIFISVIGFIIKLFLPVDYKQQGFYFNIIGLVIIILTISRCVLILSKILDLQENQNSEGK